MSQSATNNQTQRPLATVIGGSGFLGRYIVKHLADAGWTVRAGVRDVEAALFLKPLGDVGQVVPYPASLTRPETLAAAVEGADLVINLVGLLYESGSQTFQAVHVDGARALAEAAKAAGASRFIQMSAIGADLNSESEYGRTKAEGEKAVLEAFPEATILRPSVVFGPEDGFFNLFANLSRIAPVLPVFGCPVLPSLGGGEGKPVVDLYGDGGTKMQPVYVGDVADAVMACIADDSTTGKTYELGGPSVYSYVELMQLMLKIIERKRLLVPVPFALASIKAFFLELMPKPLLTRDQVTLLMKDNVVSGGALGFKDLGLEPRAAEVMLPTYLARYKAVRGEKFRNA
ncbi:MAG: complex I NDUFA9 subunit family protein [Magnetovibrionaceae bacterium]